jgi:hypothetical protein
MQESNIFGCNNGSNEGLGVVYYTGATNGTMCFGVKPPPNTPGIYPWTIRQANPNFVPKWSKWD